MTSSEVKDARRNLGWSVEIFADELGVSPRTVRRWEKGTATPPPGAVYDINRLTERCCR